MYLLVLIYGMYYIIIFFKCAKIATHKHRLQIAFFVNVSYYYHYIFTAHDVQTNTVKLHTNNYTCAYSFFILCIELYVARMQTRFVENTFLRATVLRFIPFFSVQKISQVSLTP